MKIGVFGTGTVGRTFAEKLIGLGHEVTIGTRNVAEKLADTSKDYMGNPPFSDWYKSNNKIRLGTFSEAAAFGEILINATNGAGTLTVLDSAGAKNLAGKVLMDVSNPLDPSHGMPPTLLPHLSNTTSLGEMIQKTFPEARVVKTLNTMWCGLMVNPALIAGGDHVNFLSGNDNEAKSEVKKLLYQFGWKDECLIDLGDITSARGAEAYLPLWLRLWGVAKSGAFNIRMVQ
jgi:predicted dinucleotide-binding enzyme